jgi:two-component system, OmpR family, response regulator
VTTDRYSVMIVDDEPEIRRLIERYLNREGFEVLAAADGKQMWRTLQRRQVDLVILDIRLPGEDGLSLTRQLHQSCDCAIILLTSRAEVIDRVAGLESGADDYMAKPFDPRELLARINAVLRRLRKSRLDVVPDVEMTGYEFGTWHLSIARQQLLDGKRKSVPLSPAEFNLLRLLLEFPNRVLSREFLTQRLHGRKCTPDDRGVDVRIGQLRRKLGQSAVEDRPIKTVRGTGYLLSATVKSVDTADESQ